MKGVSYFVMFILYELFFLAVSLFGLVIVLYFGVYLSSNTALGSSLDSYLLSVEKTDAFKIIVSTLLFSWFGLVQFLTHKSAQISSQEDRLFFEAIHDALSEIRVYIGLFIPFLAPRTPS